MNAVTSHEPVDAGQEIDHETCKIMGVTQGHDTSGRGLTPSLERRNSKRSMPIGMVARDLECDPPLQFIHRHCRMGSRIVAATLADVAEGRAREKMDGTHHSTNQPFDVSAIVWCGNRTMNEFYAILFRPPAQGVGPELLGIVEMDRVRKPGNRPLRINAQPLDPCLLGLNNVLDCESNRDTRGRLEREIEARNHAACDIDGKRQPWPL